MRLLKDAIGRRAMGLLAGLPGLLVLLIVVGLFLKSRAILGVEPLSRLLFSSAWHPIRGEFGLLPFIAGTVWVTVTALVLAVPVSILTAIYLSEYAPRWVREAAKPVVDLLAGLPSVVYGVWGVILVVPFVGNVLAPLAGVYSSGYSILAGGIVLAVMIAPFIIAVLYEIFATVPEDLRHASLAVGATRWQTTRSVVIPRVLPGIVAGIVLGASRAVGETMAVLMVVGNVIKVPTSIFDPAYPLPALIANNYGDMMSIPRYDAALLGAALVLLVVILGFNIISTLVLQRLLGRDWT